MIILKVPKKQDFNLSLENTILKKKTSSLFRVNHGTKKRYRKCEGRRDGAVCQNLDKNKPRPIIIKFLRYNVRAKNFKNKRKLKGKRISVTESLIKT